MKRTWILMTLVFLLCGCGREAPEAAAGTAPTQQTEPPRQEALLREVPLNTAGCIGLHPMGEDLLLLSPGTEGIILSRLSHETLATTTSAEVALAFSGLQVHKDRVSYFDPQARQTVVLDAGLRETGRIDAPEGLTGVPLLSEDGTRLFYCTEADIRCLELDTGASRVLKQDPSPLKTLRALLLGDGVIHCVYTDPTLGSRSLFLCADTGKTLREGSGEIWVCSLGDLFYAELPEALVFGTPGERPRRLLEGSATLLPGAHGAAAWDGSVLSYFDLESGLRTGELPLETKDPPRSFCSDGEGGLYFLVYDSARGCDVLCRWAADAPEAEDPTLWTVPYYTPEDPDTQGLERCREEAARISERFGIRVLVWTDAAGTEPWDYSLEPEHRVEVLLRELELLKQRLARYPQGFLRTLGERAGGIHVHLVKRISPTPENPEGTAVEGLQFWADGSGHIALTPGENSERLLYHELCHIIDTQVFSLSHAYDDWDSLNPGDFEYDYDYARNRGRDGGLYLREVSRSFIDTYSMSFPREDRARIMEYAMTPGNAEIFSAPILQQKLTKLCTGIREAFALTDYAAPLPWEQYLLKPLAPASRE